MTQEFSSNRPRIIKSLPLLQQKIGGGSIDVEQIDQMQKIIDATTVDFVPMARIYLDEMSRALKNARARTGGDNALISALIVPIMQLKANGAMFHYDLISILAKLVLDMLEEIDTLDDDILDIVDTQHQTFSLLISEAMSGMGGLKGAELVKELQEACLRYARKKGITPPETQ